MIQKESSGAWHLECDFCDGSFEGYRADLYPEYGDVLYAIKSEGWLVVPETDDVIHNKTVYLHKCPACAASD